MIEVELVSSAALALLVTLFNLLVGGSALAQARDDRSKLAFALGPIGVGLWSLAWFLSLFNPSALEGMRVPVGYAALLSVTGFTADALLELERPRARLLLAVALALTAVGLVAAPALLPDASLTKLIPRAFALAFIAVAVAARVRLLLLPGRPAEELRLDRHVLAAAAASTGVYASVAGAAWLGERVGVDPLLLVVLTAESLALAYVVNKKMEVHLLLSRAITYAILSLAVAVVAAALFHLLGYKIDLAQVTVTVAIGLFAAVVFMSAGEMVSRGVERVLFPERARLSHALRASRGEISALRRRLERAERMAITGELAASVAHEIKNPLAPIRGYAQLLGEKLAGVDPKERAMFEKGLKIIREESDRIDARVAELLRLAKNERLATTSSSTLDLNRVLLEAVAVAEGEPGVEEIVRRLDPAVTRVVGDEDELRGAISNLLKNAAEAMHGTDGRRIEVVTRAEGDRAVLEVLDEGAGLDPAAADRVFRAFYTTKEGGTGLGLAIARSAVESAQGTIAIQPRTDRRGAVVRIELMRAPDPAPSAAELPAPPIGSRRSDP